MAGFYFITGHGHPKAVRDSSIVMVTESSFGTVSTSQWARSSSPQFGIEDVHGSVEFAQSGALVFGRTRSKETGIFVFPPSHPGFGVRSRKVMSAGHVRALQAASSRVAIGFSTKALLAVRQKGRQSEAECRRRMLMG